MGDLYYRELRVLLSWVSILLSFLCVRLVSSVVSVVVLLLKCGCSMGGRVSSSLLVVVFRLVVQLGEVSILDVTSVCRLVSGFVFVVVLDVFGRA